MHTSRLLKSADKPDGLAYNKSQPGREALPVCWQLGTDYTGPMGPASHNRVPVRAYPNPTSSQATPGDLMLKGRACQNITGDQRTPGQGCHSGSPSIHRQLYIPDIPGGEERGRTEAGYKPKGPLQLCENGALQNGRPPYFARFNPARGLDDQAGLEGRIPSSPDSQREPKSPPIQMGAENIPVCVSTIWADFSPTGLHQNNETCGREAETDGYTSDHILGRYTNYAPLEGGDGTDYSPSMSGVRSPGLDGQHGEIPAYSTTGTRVPGVPGELSLPTSGFPNRENEENTTECPNPSAATAGLDKRHSQVCGESLSFNESNLAGSPPLQSLTVHDELGSFIRSSPHDEDDQVQRQTESYRGSQSRSVLVDFPGSTLHDGVLPITSGPSYDHSVRRIQHRLGCMSRGSPDRRNVVKGRIFEPHQLSGTASSFFGTPVLCKAEVQHHHPVKDGQPVSCDLYKQNGRDPLSGLVQPGNITVELEPAAKHIPACRVPSWEGEHSGRPGIKGIEGQMRLDDKSSCFQSDPIPDGPMRDRSLCIASNKTASKVFLLETGPRSRGHRCLQPELGDGKVLCQSSMVPHSSVPITGEKTDGKDGDNHPTVELPAMVSNYPRSTGKFSSPSPSEDRPGSPANNARICHEAGSSGASCMAHLRGSFTSQGISSAASELLLSSWRTKTKSNYNSLFAKWANWCQQRDRDPTTGPIKDIINFLAELYQDGYQYRSLNSYRSAISAVHSKVDDHPVGQHPLVSRMLKGVFNERPPLSRYSTFWDVGAVLRYLKQLGSNDSLTLRLLTIKSVMLLALARPSRSMDLSKLDIQHRTYTSAGLVFKAQHLSKQSRPSKSLSDFYYPRFSDDTDVCPVATIQAYEQRTIQFRTPMSVTGKTSLFLSWIGKHEPVTSSTIARWLKTCLHEAGIDTGVFKAHSVRGAASSKAAWSGVTISDILQAADWSSETTFQRFYHRPTDDKNKSSFGMAVLSSVGTSNLHVDMETEPSEM